MPAPVLNVGGADRLEKLEFTAHAAAFVDRTESAERRASDAEGQVLVLRRELDMATKTLADAERVAQGLREQVAALQAQVEQERSHQRAVQVLLEDTGARAKAWEDKYHELLMKREKTLANSSTAMSRTNSGGQLERAISGGKDNTGAGMSRNGSNDDFSRTSSVVSMTPLISQVSRPGQDDTPSFESLPAEECTPAQEDQRAGGAEEATAAGNGGAPYAANGGLPYVASTARGSLPQLHLEPPSHSPPRRLHSPASHAAARGDSDGGGIGLGIGFDAPAGSGADGLELMGDATQGRDVGVVLLVGEHVLVQHEVQYEVADEEEHKQKGFQDAMQAKWFAQREEVLGVEGGREETTPPPAQSPTAAERLPTGVCDAEEEVCDAEEEACDTASVLPDHSHDTASESSGSPLERTNSLIALLPRCYWPEFVCPEADADRHEAAGVEPDSGLSLDAVAVPAGLGAPVVLGGDEWREEGEIREERESGEGQKEEAGEAGERREFVPSVTQRRGQRPQSAMRQVGWWPRIEHEVGLFPIWREGGARERDR